MSNGNQDLTRYISDNTVSYTPTAPDLAVSPSEIKPFVKWAGGKKQLLPELRSSYPEELGRELTKYAEPFVGGGAVLFDILSSYKLSEIYISDVNAELIDTYHAIRDYCEDLISFLDLIQTEYLAKTDEERQVFFSEMRYQFNLLKNGAQKDIVEIAALFIFLNRTCFNGLYRVNSRNEFNVPAGRYKNPVILNEENLRNVSAALRNVEIVCGDFREALSFIDEKTFVYFDPPYRPLSTTASFTSYAKSDFNDDEQKALADFVRKVDAKGARFLLSNSDPKNTNPDDTFFDDLYAGFYIRRISASRMINSNAEKRGKINELLISNYWSD